MVYLSGIHLLVLHVNWVDAHVGLTHPGFSSDASPQSSSPSHTRSMPMHLLLLHVNWFSEHVTGGHPISSELSRQSSFPSHFHFEFMQRLLLQRKPEQGIVVGARVAVTFAQPNMTYREQSNKFQCSGTILT